MATTSSRTYDAYEYLRAELLACRRTPGERLKIDELSKNLSVSPGAVREALSRLTSEGFVTAVPQRGFRVAPVSVDELHDLTSVRIEIEALCLERALTVGDLGWQSRVVGAHHRLVHTPKVEPRNRKRVSDKWIAAHSEYHAALVAGCDSPWLLKIRELLFNQAERFRRHEVAFTNGGRDIEHGHDEILAAAVARDASRARKLLTQHLTASTRIFLHTEIGSEMHGKPRSGTRRARKT
jgi:DNA-binding GntR family transcriptional regulator